MIGLDLSETEEVQIPHVPNVRWTLARLPYGKLAQFEDALAEARRPLAGRVDFRVASPEDDALLRRVERDTLNVYIDIVRWGLRAVDPPPPAGIDRSEAEEFDGRRYPLVARHQAERIAMQQVPIWREADDGERFVYPTSLARLVGDEVLRVCHLSEADRLGFTQPRTETTRSTST